jgi:glycosyltransferase involved in cell wall biosynthesis
MSKVRVLYLSRTDINVDSRILKSMAAAEEKNFSVFGIGVKSEFTKFSSSTSSKIKTISLIAKKLTFIPKGLSHFLSVIEFTFRVLSHALKFKPRLIHCNDPNSLPAALLIKRMLKAKLVYDAHELESNKNGLSKLLGKLTFLLEKFSWSSIDSLIVVSPSIENWYLNNIGFKRSAVILNSPLLGLDSNYQSNYLRNKFGIAENIKLFIYIGILGRGRGIDLLLDVFPQLNGKASMVFLGFGEYEEKIKEISKKHGNIYFHSAVPHDQVINVARSADFGVCLIENVSLSDYYSLPNKLFEYTFAGVPVIASDFPDINKIVEKYNMGLCVDLAADSVLNTVNSIINSDVQFDFSPKDLKELAWDAQAKKLITLYNETLKQN